MKSHIKKTFIIPLWLSWVLSLKKNTCVKEVLAAEGNLSTNTEQSQTSSSSQLNFCCSLLKSVCPDLVMSQEYQSTPGLEMGLLFTFFQKIQRGWDFYPAETDAPFLFCIFKHQQGRENCCKNPGASSWDSSELSWKNTGWWFEHWRVRAGLLGARIWAQICKNTNEHWHHLRRGCWPPIIPAINHQVLLPNADRIRRGGKNSL